MNYYSVDITDYYNNKFLQDPDHYIDWLLKLATKAKKNVKSKDFLLVCHILFESYPLETKKDRKQYIQLFKCFAKRRLQTALLLSPWDNAIDRTSFVGTNIHVFNYHAWIIHHLIIKKKLSPTNANWNPNGKKYLMLTGKPNAINRVRLLWKLSQQNLLEKSIWSMLVRPGTWKQSKLLLPELTEDEFANFVKKYNRQADKATINFQKKSLHYIGIPYDVSMYEDSLFRIIPDTRFRTTDKPMLSEKIYTTILNRLPFIMAGDTGSLRWLKQQGFRTFENYLPMPDYDDITNPEQRLDAIVYNCKFWIEAMTDKNQIAEDVIYNYNLLCKKVQQIEYDMQKFMEKFALGKLGPIDVCKNGNSLMP